MCRIVKYILVACYCLNTCINTYRCANDDNIDGKQSILGACHSNQTLTNI